MIRYFLLAASTLWIGRTLREWYDARMLIGRNRPDPEEEPEEEQLGSTVVLHGEELRIFEWRMKELRAAGFGELHATALAVGDNQKWRDAIRLVSNGCEHRLAIEILL